MWYISFLFLSCYFLHKLAAIYGPFGFGPFQALRRKVKLVRGQFCCMVALWPLDLTYIKTLSWKTFMGFLESLSHPQCWEPQLYSSFDIGDDAFSSDVFLIPSMILRNEGWRAHLQLLFDEFSNIKGDIEQNGANTASCQFPCLCDLCLV